MRSIIRCLAGTLMFAIAAGCSGSGDSSPQEPNPVIAKTATNSGDGQIAAVTEAFSQDLRVIVTLNGQPVEDADVTWAVSANGGTIAPPTATTGADGIAFGEWTLGTKSGDFTATAALAGASGSPVTFSGTAQPDVASQFVIAAGNNESGVITSAFSEPLQVRMKDQYDNPIPGQNVNWSVTSGAAQLAGAVSATSASGVATMNGTYGDTPGPIVIHAAPQNGLPAVDFNATATPPPTEITIQVQNNMFSPQVDTVAAGGTVTWNWVGNDHNVTPNAASPTASGTHDTPFTYDFTFVAPGTYNYHCTNHPPGMVGTIVVI